MRTLAAALFVVLLPASALAQPAEADAPPPVTTELLTPTPPEWKLGYDDARAKLATGDFAGAAAKFAALEASAVNRVDRTLAHEQQTLAAEWAARGLAFVKRQELGESAASAKAVDTRTTDELVSLYTNAVFYGIGSGVWLGVLTKPSNAAGGILPAFALTGASVGAVAAFDAGRGFRYGVPQSSVSGLWIGFEEGLLWGLWLGNKYDDFAEAEATIVWGGATVGALAGGILGQALGTTPGRSSWVGSTALWSGTLFGFTMGAFTSDADAVQPALVAGGIGVTLGTAAGLATATEASPSIARVRFLDLGGICGGLLSSGLYLAAADQEPNGHATSGVAALGAAGGLVTAWLLTSGMTPDRTGLPERGTGMAGVRPMLIPTSHGAMMGLGGALD